MNPQKHAECSSSQGTQTDSNPSPFICQVGEAGWGERQAREGWGAGQGGVGGRPGKGWGQARELGDGMRNAQPATVFFVTCG